MEETSEVASSIASEGTTALTGLLKIIIGLALVGILLILIFKYIWDSLKSGVADATQDDRTLRDQIYDWLVSLGLFNLPPREIGKVKILGQVGTSETKDNCRDRVVVTLQDMYGKTVKVPEGTCRVLVMKANSNGQLPWSCGDVNKSSDEVSRFESEHRNLMTGVQVDRRTNDGRISFKLIDKVRVGYATDCDTASGQGLNKITTQDKGEAIPETAAASETILIKNGDKTYTIDKGECKMAVVKTDQDGKLPYFVYNKDKPDDDAVKGTVDRVFNFAKFYVTGVGDYLQTGDFPERVQTKYKNQTIAVKVDRTDNDNPRNIKFTAYQKFEGDDYENNEATCSKTK